MVTAMAKVIYKPRIDLWRIVDGRTSKPLRTNHNKAVDNGGQRTELDAHRLLKEYNKLPIPRATTRAIAKEAQKKVDQRLERIAANVRRKLAKAKP